MQAHLVLMSSLIELIDKMTRIIKIVEQFTGIQKWYYKNRKKKEEGKGESTWG